jgi:hypothetical protein
LNNLILSEFIENKIKGGNIHVKGNVVRYRIKDLNSLYLISKRINGLLRTPKIVIKKKY